MDKVLYRDCGKTRVSRYAFSGEIRTEESPESKEVPCLSASLSEQDFESVG